MPDRNALAHSSECVAKYVASKVARKLWRQLWPDACPDCRGRGTGSYQPDPSSNGECLRCLGNGVCPRCDEEDAIIGRESPSCSHCGWTPTAADAAEPPLSPCLGPAGGCREEVAHG